MVLVGGAVDRCLCPEVGILMNGISALWKRTQTSFCHLRIQSEDFNTKEGPHVTMLAPLFQTSSLLNWRNKILLFISCLYKLWSFVRAA